MRCGRWDRCSTELTTTGAGEGKYPRGNIARAAVEGVVCSVADGLAALTDLGVSVQRQILVSGGARSEALQKITGAVFRLPATVPEPGEYAADGAAQASRRNPHRPVSR